MDRRHFLVRAALAPAALSLVSVARGQEAAAEGEWIQLFNGQDLTGWTPKICGFELGDNHADTFRVEDGVLMVRYDKYEGPFNNRFGHLFYKDSFSNYALRVEYRFVGEQVPGGPGWALRNSGAMIHGQTAGSMGVDQQFPVSIEVQFLGGDGQSERSTGNLCTPGTHVVYEGELRTEHITNSSSDTFHGDQWVTCEVEVHGGKLIRHKINGEVVLEYSEPQLDDRDADAQRLLAAGSPKMIASGTISLQAESHPVEFRKVELMVLEDDETAATDPVELSHPEAFMLAVLPDTQYYSEKWHDHYHAQTRWIAENAARLNIKYVLHEGDIVNNNGREQWVVAQAAMRRLHGVVPYALAPGNHDYGPGGSAITRDTLLNEYFSADEQATWPTFGGAMEPGKLENTYHLFEAGGREYLVLALEWGPRDETVAWANRICDEHPDARVILLTHAYMYNDETRYDWQTHGDKQQWNPHAYGAAKLAGGVNDGQELWDKLIRPRKGFFLTLNGHVLGDGAGRLSSRGDHGNLVHQLLANYQMNHEGGEAYLRLVEIAPDNTLCVRSYSPALRAFKTAADQQFDLELEFATA
jgi:3',5'-cyclic AMP phosphodiesterase CpdA